MDAPRRTSDPGAYTEFGFMTQDAQSTPADGPEHPAIAHPSISIVVPAYNEEEVLPELLRRTVAVLDPLPYPYEIVFVDDGSTDRTAAVMNDLRAQNPQVTVVQLSRNFGKEIALTAGLDHARGDAVVAIDADLQDPPELIPKLVDEWLGGADMVYAQRTVREGESWLKKVTAHVFYRVMHRFGPVKLPRDTGDFRLMSRRAVEGIKQLRERHRFMKGLFAWVGYRQVAVPYERDARFAGTTKWNYLQLWNLSVEGLTSFTVAPLKLAAYFGFLSALFAFGLGGWIFFSDEPIPGQLAVLAAVLFLGGVQLIAIGIIGEYLGRIFNETKNRPLYLTQEVAPSSLREGGAHGPESIIRSQ